MGLRRIKSHQNAPKSAPYLASAGTNFNPGWIFSILIICWKFHSNLFLTITMIHIYLFIYLYNSFISSLTNATTEPVHLADLFVERSFLVAIVAKKGQEKTSQSQSCFSLLFVIIYSISCFFFLFKLECNYDVQMSWPHSSS